MPSFKDVQAFNASYKPSYIPVAIITGATHGVGRAMTIALARHLKGRVHIILVGRNRTAAEEIIANLPRTSSYSDELDHPQHQEEESKYEFIQCDITKMRNIHAMADDLKQCLTKVNFIVHCAGEASLSGWQDNGEGIDTIMAGRYYSRWALTYDLIPLLKSAKAGHESASVLSVMAGGFGKWIDASDIGLRKTHTGVRGILQSVTYNDFMVTEFARREPDISFTHTGPGFVVTYRWVYDNPITKILSLPLRPFIWLFSTPVEHCAEYMLYGLLANSNGGHLRNWRGDEVPLYDHPETERILKELWDHSLDVTVTSLQ